MLQRIRSNELVKGSFVLFIMINAFNVLNYLYHFFMARMLGPADYGILAVLFSFIYLFSIPGEAIQNIMTAYTSKLSLSNQDPKIKYLLKKSLKKAVYFSAIAFIIFLPLSLIASHYLKISFFLLAFTGLLIFLFFMTPIARGVLQGKKKFFSLGTSMIIEASLKILFGIALVYFGLKVYGAITAVLIAVFLSLGYSIVPLKRIFKEKEEKEDFPGIYKYSIPYFVIMVAFVVMYSSDVLLAKIFFQPDVAGKYAVASMLGKMILFGSAAVGKAMFPLSAEKHITGEKTSSLIKNSLKIISLLILVSLTLFLLFPKLIVTILFGASYSGASSVLFIVGLSLSVLSISNLLLLYNLAKNRTQNSWLLFLPLILELILVLLFHATLVQFALSFLAANTLFFLVSLFLFLNQKNKPQSTIIPHLD